MNQSPVTTEQEQPFGDDLDRLDDAGVHEVAVREHSARWAAAGDFAMSVATVLRVVARSRIHRGTVVLVMMRTPSLRQRIRQARAERAALAAAEESPQ